MVANQGTIGLGSSVQPGQSVLMGRSQSWSLVLKSELLLREILTKQLISAAYQLIKRETQ